VTRSESEVFGARRWQSRVHANSVSSFQGYRIRGELAGYGRRHGIVVESEDERSGQQEVGTDGLGGGGADGVMRKHKCWRKLRLTPRPSVTLHTLFLRISQEAVRLGTPNIISSSPEHEHGATVNQQSICFLPPRVERWHAILRPFAAFTRREASGLKLPCLTACPARVAFLNSARSTNDPPITCCQRRQLLPVSYLPHGEVHLLTPPIAYRYWRVRVRSRHPALSSFSMYELLLYGQVPVGRHEQVLKILAGLAAMQPLRILERCIIYKPQREPEEPGLNVRRGGTQNIALKQGNKPATAAAALYYTKLIQKLSEHDFGIEHGKPLSADVKDGEDAKWSTRWEDQPDTGDRGVSIRFTNTTDLLSGDPHAHMIATGPNR